MLKSVQAPRGTFIGVNFMTPNITGYYKLRNGYAELSTGRGINHQPLYGVTIKPDPDRTLSKVFRSQEEALSYIAQLS